MDRTEKREFVAALGQVFQETSMVVVTRNAGLTVTEVRGFGRQFGQPVPGTDHDLGLPRSVALLPKVRLDLVVPDDNADVLAEVLAKHARTGEIGDGKLWMSEVASVLRVRTGDRDLAAL